MITLSPYFANPNPNPTTNTKGIIEIPSQPLGKIYDPNYTKDLVKIKSKSKIKRKSKISKPDNYFAKIKF